MLSYICFLQKNILELTLKKLILRINFFKVNSIILRKANKNLPIKKHVITITSYL